MRRNQHRPSILALGIGALLATSCAASGSPSPFGDSVALTANEESALTERGVEMLGERVTDAPVYRLTADVDPATGRVEGTLAADLPVGEDAELARLRYFPALVDPEASVTDVEVAETPVDATLDSSLLTVPLEAGENGRVELTATFAFTVPEVPETDLLGGLGEMAGDEALQPSSIGLLGRQSGVVNLGHWFPIWVPDGLSADPTPEGFGDIGNFPTAVLEVEIEEPSGWTVVTGGVRHDRTDSRVVEAGSGLRDLALVLVDDAVTREATTGDTTVRVTAPASSSPDEVLDEVLQESVTSLEVLSEELGPYPWAELDVVATPLGAGVGGMEYPGMVWVESSIFAGGLPGVGDLDLGLDDLDLGELDDDLEDLDLGDLEDLGLEGLDGENLLDEEGLEGAFDEDFQELLALLFDMLSGAAEGSEAFDDLDDFNLDELDLDELAPGGPGLEDELADLDLGDLDLGTALDPDVLESTRAWVVAHEVAHQWWHAVVGNDSITAPLVDEPLAQYSSCVVFHEAWPENADKICDANLAGGYQQMRSLGVEDAPADQTSDEFDSMLQYGGVIYGKAPLFYSTLADQFGEAAVADALASFVQGHAFEQVSSEELRTALGEELGDRATVDMLWARWFEGTFGDEDVLD